MEISGHKTRGVFERYHIVSTDDVAKALERAQAYIEENNTKPVVESARFSHVSG